MHSRNCVSQRLFTPAFSSVMSRPPNHETIGTVTIDAEQSSLIGRLARSALALLIWEGRA